MRERRGDAFMDGQMALGGAGCEQMGLSGSFLVMS